MPSQHTEGISSRKRRPNWTDQECLLLAQLMQERKGIIKGRCSTGVSIQNKRQAWEEIAQAMNTAFPQIQRTVLDCNKKWENLLAKSREEIKRHKRQADTEGLSIEQFSTVTQLVISVMKLSEFVQQDKAESPKSVSMENQQNRSDEEGHDHTIDYKCNSKHPLTDFPATPDPPSCSAKKQMIFSDIPKSLTAQFSVPHAACFNSATEQLADTACSSSSAPLIPNADFQERMDLEMSVLKRQDAVLKLQEEYYTLKIKLLKKQMKEPPLKD